MKHCFLGKVISSTVLGNYRQALTITGEEETPFHQYMYELFFQRYFWLNWASPYKMIEAYPKKLKTSDFLENSNEAIVRSAMLQYFARFSNESQYLTEENCFNLFEADQMLTKNIYGETTLELKYPNKYPKQMVFILKYKVFIFYFKFKFKIFSKLKLIFRRLIGPKDYEHGIVRSFELLSLSYDHEKVIFFM